MNIEQAMLSDEEKKAIEDLKEISHYCSLRAIDIEDKYSDTWAEYVVSIQKVFNLIKKQQKELEELNRENTRQHELIDKIHQKWEDKIKAKVVEIKNRPVKDMFITATQGKLDTIIELESLLEEE